MNAQVRPRKSSRIIIMRHSERLDFALNSNRWPREAFVNNVYRPNATQMLSNLPMREDPLEYELDTPLSKNGREHARQMGEYFYSIGFIPDRIYVSPSFRCVQTAHAVLEGLQLDGHRALRLDLALHEPTKVHIPVQTPDHFQSAGYLIDRQYQPVLPTTKIDEIRNESSKKYYERMHRVLKRIVQTPSNPRNILVVTHMPCVIPLCAMLNIDSVPASEHETYLRNFLIKSRDDVKFMSYAIADYDARKNIWNFHHTYPARLPDQMKRKC